MAVRQLACGPATALLDSYALGEVPRLVGIEPACHSQLICEHLGWQSVYDRSCVANVCNLDVLIPGFAREWRYADDVSAACLDLLSTRHDTAEGFVVGSQNNAGRAWLDQSDSAMFHFATRECFSVHITDFFYLERCLEGERVTRSTA